MPSARVMRRQVRLLLTPADNTKTPVRVHTHTHGTPVHTPADKTGPHALGRWCSPPRNVPGGGASRFASQRSVPDSRAHARTHAPQVQCLVPTPLESPTSCPPPSLSRFARPASLTHALRASLAPFLRCKRTRSAASARPRGSSRSAATLPGTPPRRRTRPVASPRPPTRRTRPFPSTWTPSSARCLQKGRS